MRPALDRLTLTFLARRLTHSIEVEFRFQATGLSDMEPRTYLVLLTLDPHMRRVTSAMWQLVGADEASTTYSGGSKDRQLIVETELRDLFLMSQAWEQLRLSPADPFIAIDEKGRTHGTR